MLLTDRDQVDVCPVRYPPPEPRPRDRPSGSPPGHPDPRRGHAFTDRDQVDVYPVRYPPPEPRPRDRPSGSPPGHPDLRRGHALNGSRSGGCVPSQASASIEAIMPLPKKSDGRPLAGSSPATRGLTHPAARRLLLRSATGRRDGNHPVRQASPAAVRAGGCDAMAGRESAASCRRPEILGRAAAAGEGTAIRIFCRRGYWPHGAGDCRCTDPPDRDP
jgi:hypothetical protein